MARKVQGVYTVGQWRPMRAGAVLGRAFLFQPVLGPLRSWWKEERRTLPSGRVRRGVFTVLGLGLLPLSVLEIQRRSQALEEKARDQHREAMAIVVASLASLRRTAYDWGHWDDMYAFVRGTKPSFVRTDVATTSLFDGGGVLVVLDPAARPLLVYSDGGRDRAADLPLAECVRRNIRRLGKPNDIGLRLACPDGTGQWMLGVATPITSNTSAAPSHGALAMFEPLVRSEYGAEINERLIRLGQRLVPLSADTAQAIEPPLYGAAGEIVVARTPTREALLNSLATDLLRLLALGLVILGVRAMLLLERRRQILVRRRMERSTNHRIRHAGRELDRLLARTGMDAAAPEADQRVMARLLEPEAMPRGEAEQGLERQLELLARRFQHFLRGARSLALFDPLTQLPNRRYFIEHLELQAEKEAAKDRRFAILFIDVDRFKSINDTYGHAIGDALLVVVADRLQMGMRSGDFLARYGGDEFAMLVVQDDGDVLDQRDARAAAFSLASRIASAFEAPVHLPGVELQLSISIGIDLETLEEGKAELTMKRCDIAMSRAKQHKHTRIAIFDVGESSAPLDNYRFYVDLIQAVRDHDINVVFQPIVAADGRLHGVEALARWEHPNLGPISPELFLDLAERHRQILLLGNELLEVSLERYAELDHGVIGLGVAAGAPRLSLNLAPSILSDPGLVERLERQLERHKIAPERLTIELTERSVIERNTVVLANLKALRSMGMRLSLDDFGTGYSSLHLLSSLEPDEVKIDKSFVMAMRSDDLARQIVRMVAGMAPSMGMEIVAEGVDDANTLAQLEELGVHRFQGYLFSRALTVSDLLARCTSGSEGLQLHPSDPGPAMAAPQAG